MLLAILSNLILFISVVLLKLINQLYSMVVFLHHNSFIPNDFLRLINHLFFLVILDTMILLDSMVLSHHLNHLYWMVIFGFINHLYAVFYFLLRFFWIIWFLVDFKSFILYGYIDLQWFFYNIDFFNSINNLSCMVFIRFYDSFWLHGFLDILNLLPNMIIFYSLILLIFMISCNL